MNFALSDEHILLRDTAQSFVDAETSLEELLVPGASVANARYKENWEQIKALGWPGLIVEEQYAGVGLDCIELAVIVTELGRTLMPSPFAGHVFGTWALQKAGSEVQKNDYLGSAATGEITLALVAPLDGCINHTSNGVLNGEHRFVVDALSATHLVVCAKDSGENLNFFLVPTNHPGVDIELQPWRDITRQVCRVRFDNVEAESMPGEASCWPWIHDRISCFLAAENVGGLRKVLDETVDYANERVAFGRPIGSYQAVKHPLAEMLGHVESANVAVLYAAWALAENDERASLAASMAKAFSSEAYVAGTHKSIQIFGAIGFTWEMQNHLYFKRARSNAELFGNARAHRDHVMNLATKQKWSEPFLNLAVASTG